MNPLTPSRPPPDPLLTTSSPPPHPLLFVLRLRLRAQEEGMDELLAMWDKLEAELEQMQPEQLLKLGLIVDDAVPVNSAALAAEVSAKCETYCETCCEANVS
eukprot:549294-Prorocentrum_minimum.AAC.1